MDNPDKKIAELEALLFLNGEPVLHARIAAALGLEAGACDAVVAELGKRLQQSDRGLYLVSDKNKVQLATKPELGNVLEEFVKEELAEELSPASVETLAIIAYLGPIARAKIEYLRGVNSSVILRSLTLRGLVERVQDPDHTSGFLYKTTFDFMKHIGLRTSEELPEFEKFKGLLKVFEEKDTNKSSESPS
jgi:segregation and condensation protein B